MARSRKEKRERRKRHIRKTVYGTAEKPRVGVFKSNRYLYAFLVDDDRGHTLASLCEKKLKSKKDEKPVDRASRLGEKFAEMIKKTKVDKTVFDRSGYKFHGRIKAFAEALREAGIKF